MKIGIEAERANHNKKTGVEHYAKQVIQHLANIDNQNQYILYLRTQPENWIRELPQNFSYKLMPFPYLWTQVRLSFELLFHPPDVLFIPASSVPLIHPRRTVAVIHDLAFWFYPETYSKLRVLAHKFYDYLTLRFASKIIVVSNSTKKDALSVYKCDEKKIAVVHHGYEAQKASTETNLYLPSRYLLFLATLQPRKNLISLIHAFRQFKNSHSEDTHKLVVVGKPGWLYEPILKVIEENKDIVNYLGHVSDDDRLVILKKASALALPSFYEGFGMQILEGFDAGIPVITSSTSSMPEVAGGAALYFDPKDVNSIQTAIEKALLDPECREDLINKSRHQLAQFSWDKCAKETLKIITS